MSTQDILTKYSEGKILDDVFRNIPWGLPANLYVGLLTGITTPEDGIVTEVSAGEYTRVTVPRDGSNWSNSATIVSNDNDILYPQPTSNWGTVSYWGIYDAISGGNLLMYGQMDDAKTIDDSSQQPKWGVGQFKVQLNLTTTLFSNKIADWLFLNSALGFAANLDFGLFTVTPSGPSDSGTEVTGNNYSRTSVSRNSGNFNDPAGTGQTGNSNEIAYSVPTPSGWGSIEGMGVFSGADLLLFDGFSPVVVNANDAPKFAQNSFTYSID